MMTIQEFIIKFREAFGDAAPLPVSLAYGATPENELTFTIPMSRFKEMLDTMNDSALYQKAFSALKRRINK